MIMAWVKRSRRSNVWDNDERGMSVYVSGAFANGSFVSVRDRKNKRWIIRDKQFDPRRNMKPNTTKSLRLAIAYAKRYMKRNP